MKHRAYITYKITGTALKALQEECNLIINEEGRMLNKEELCRNIKGMDAVITMYNDCIDKDVIDCMQGAKIIANYAVGYNNIDYEYAKSKGIAVTNTPNVLTNATADLTVGLILAVSRHIVDSNRYILNGRFKGWMPDLYLGLDLTGKTIGIIGAGRIGSCLVKKLKGFEMKILYYNRTRNKELENEFKAIYTDKDKLLRESDFISIHVPLTSETKHMIGEKEFSLMKKTAVLINTSRGPVIDEKALVNALNNKLLWGVGLDVFENEPDIEKELLTFDNVILTPHIGSSTKETRERMVDIVVSNVLTGLRGERPLNCINFK